MVYLHSYLLDREKVFLESREPFVFFILELESSLNICVCVSG